MSATEMCFEWLCDKANFNSFFQWLEQTSLDGMPGSERQSDLVAALKLSNEQKVKIGVM